MSIRNEVVMQRFLFALCVMCIASSPGISQVATNKAQPQTPPSAETKSGETKPAEARSSEKTPAPDRAARGDAAAAKPSGKTTAASDGSDDFIIGSEDVLEIKVWREPDLTTRAVVRPDGKIGVTLLGDVQASGLTATQLKEAITAKLERFLEQPEVSVVVVEIHSQTVHLIGAVGRPGAYALGGPLTIVELLSRAGGLAETAKADQISIVRQRGHGEIERIPFNYKEFLEGKNLHSNIQLKNGDVIVVR